MLEQCWESIATGAMPELFLYRESLLVMDEFPSLLVQLLKHGILHSAHADDLGSRHGSAHLGLDLVKLGRGPPNIVERKIGTMRWAKVLWVIIRAAPLPGGMSSNVPTTAIAAWASQSGTDFTAAPWISWLRVVH